MWSRVEKGIYQEGKYSFRVRMMSSGHKLDKTFDDLASARNFRDSHKLSQSLDIHESSIIESRIKKRSVKNFYVNDALTRYAKEITPSKKGASVEQSRINKTLRTKLASKPLFAVSPEDVLSFLREIGGSENNQRKYASLISHLYRTAIKKWKMPVENPVSGKIDMPSNGKPRDRRLIGNEYQLLLDELQGEAKAFFVIAIETAMRRGEQLSIKKKDVSIKDRSITLFDTKNGEDRTVPLSNVAIEAIKPLMTSKGDMLFTITKSKLCGQWAVVRATIGSTDLRIHDLRHEATSRLFEKDLNVIEAQSVTGHKTLAMLARYTHLTPSNIADKLNKKP